MLEYPSNYIITSGSGASIWRLVAFDNALASAGLSNYNLLKVTSILPAGCKEQSKIQLKEGSAVLTAFSTIASNTPGDRISAAVAVGIPEDERNVGIIMEYSCHDSSLTAELAVKEMVYESMSNHRISCKEIKSKSAEATVMEGRYTSVVAALAFW